MPRPPASLCGTVVSAGRMMKAVKVRTTKQVYNSFLKKHFLHDQFHLVSDPNSSLRQGDTVRIAQCLPISRHIRHVVVEILAPWGPAVEERPPVLGELERFKVRQEKRERKLERKRRKSEGLTEGSQREEELSEAEAQLAVAQE